MRNRLALGLLALALGAGGTMPATAADAPVWVVDPAAPGDDLPRVGRSLFDRLFAVERNGKAEVAPPFPFTALLARLEAQVQRDPAASLPPVKPVLIPLGRSLQRTAATPDYFAFPRVVVAVDGNPAPGAPLQKDRLYIGYQEKSAVLEVISYNEAAGRFEFQLVKDYRPGGRPRVYYAPRTLCFACHQNGSPIFSRAVWDETNANPRIATQLAATGRNFYGIPPDRGIDIPYAIDNATEHANGYALTQRLWQEGCGADDPVARRCRAGLFAAALTRSLADGQAWAPDDTFDATVAAPLRATAARHWPGGLATGNPDLPNRNPLQGLASWPDDPARRVAASHVPARFEPLLPRPTRALWRPATPEALAEAVAGLAEFVAADDRQRLEDALVRQPGIATREIVLPCDGAPAASRWSLRCAGPAGSLNGTLALHGSRVASGQIDSLALPGGTSLTNLTITPGSPAAAARGSLNLRRQGRLPRTAAGDAITGLTLTRDDTGRWQASLRLRQEGARLQAAVVELAATPTGAELFGPAPFPRERLFAALATALGAPPAKTCCEAARRLPPPALEFATPRPGEAGKAGAGAGIAGFYAYCAACHLTAETFPPNFLHGDAAQVESRLHQCAPRLWVRLTAPDIAPEARDKTPMPPETKLPTFGTDAHGWKTGPARAALLAQVEGWLKADGITPASLRALPTGSYESLRPCLPPAPALPTPTRGSP